MKLIDWLVENLDKHGGWPEGVKRLNQSHDLILENYHDDGDSYPLKKQITLPACDNLRTFANYVSECGADFVTKEQYLYAKAAKNEGWIPWYGGECPVGADTLVMIKRRDGEVTSWHRPAAFSWELQYNKYDIIAYRLQKQESESDEADLNECIGQAVEWDGEGLPPVGVEFEYGSHRTKAKCIAIGHHMIFASKGNPDDEEGDFEEFMISILDSEFHPLRTEAERKREYAIEYAIESMVYSCTNFNNTSVIHAIRQVCNAIAAGKIPGVKLVD